MANKKRTQRWDVEPMEEEEKCWRLQCVKSSHMTLSHMIEIIKWAKLNASTNTRSREANNSRIIVKKKESRTRGNVAQLGNSQKKCYKKDYDCEKRTKSKRQTVKIIITLCVGCFFLFAQLLFLLQWAYRNLIEPNASFVVISSFAQPSNDLFSVAIFISFSVLIANDIHYLFQARSSSFTNDKSIFRRSVLFINRSIFVFSLLFFLYIWPASKERQRKRTKNESEEKVEDKRKREKAVKWMKRKLLRHRMKCIV